MLPPRAPERAKTHARKPRVYRRTIARLTRVQARGGAGRGSAHPAFPAA